MVTSPFVRVAAIAPLEGDRAKEQLGTAGRQKGIALTCNLLPPPQSPRMYRDLVFRALLGGLLVTSEHNVHLCGAGVHAGRSYLEEKPTAWREPSSEKRYED